MQLVLKERCSEMDFYIYLYDYPAYWRSHNFYLSKLLILLLNLELLYVTLLMQSCMRACICRSAWVTGPDYLLWLHRV